MNGALMQLYKKSVVKMLDVLNVNIIAFTQLEILYALK